MGLGKKKKKRTVARLGESHPYPFFITVSFAARNPTIGILDLKSNELQMTDTELWGRGIES
jgi:hypothetical protein